MKVNFIKSKECLKSVDKKVIYLKREEFGPLKLDESLEEGEYRELTDEEISILKNL